MDLSALYFRPLVAPNRSLIKDRPNGVPFLPILTYVETTQNTIQYFYQKNAKILKISLTLDS